MNTDSECDCEYQMNCTSCNIHSILIVSMLLSIPVNL